jgi:hypothetical protein
VSLGHVPTTHFKIHFFEVTRFGYFDKKKKKNPRDFKRETLKDESFIDR